MDQFGNEEILIYDRLGIHLTGKMSGWTTPKDLILHIAGKLTVRVTVSPKNP
jgi:aconitase A